MNKQNGMTLVEVLAALVLVSLVFTLVVGVIINSLNSFNRQQSDNLNTADMTILLNQITSEVRKNPNAISITSNELKIASKSDSPILYYFDSTAHSLFRNGNLLSKNVVDFNLDFDSDILTVSIEDSKSKDWETKIVLRRGTR